MTNSKNLTAFLDMLAFSEGTATHPLTRNSGYDVIVTGLDGRPEIFTDYRDHPFAAGRPAKVFNRRGEKSTASGRYQQLYLFWPHYQKQMALPDFSPASQDKLAVQLISERRALADIERGDIERAISKCRTIWASLPGAGYGQWEHHLDTLIQVYQQAGGGAGMMNPWVKFVGLVIVCLFCMVAVNKWQLSGAEHTVSQQAIALSQQKDTLLAQSAAISALQGDIQRNERAQVDLRIKLSQAGQLAASRDNTITRLLNENAVLRRWYGAAMPDAIKRLHQRPAFDGPDAYLRWLSESNPLPDTGQQPANQR